MAVSALHLTNEKNDDANDDSPTMMGAVDIYLRLKNDKNSQTIIRAARRNGRYV